MKRTGYEVDDIQSVLYAVILKFVNNTAPWTRWSVMRGYPETEYFATITKPFIYLDTPILTDDTYIQGGLGHGSWEMILGCWDTRDTGGIEEVQIMSSSLLSFFRNPQSCHTKVFDVTLGTTAYSNTTLKAQGIHIQNISGPRNISEAIKDFRQELTLFLRA
jgi:hypothetical protein